MPLLIPPGFSAVSMQFRHSLDPEPWYVTFGVDSDSAGGDFELMGAAICGIWWSNLRTWLSNEVILTGCNVTVGSDGGAPLRLWVPFVGGQGDDSAAKLPQNCAGLVRKNTGQGGRRNQGRFFMPGLIGEEQTNAVGIIDGPDRAAIQVGFTGVFDDMAAGHAMVILHNSEGDTPPGDPTPVTSLVLDGVIATQRRRLR